MTALVLPVSLYRWHSAFWERVDSGDPDDCWPWIAARNTAGYGVAHVPKSFPVEWMAGRLLGAHRIVLALQGDVRDELWALHRCNVKPCCNPAHLYLGDRYENAEDYSRSVRLSFRDRLARLEAVVRARADGIDILRAAYGAEVDRALEDA
jgi:hypothetical protein